MVDRLLEVLSTTQAGGAGSASQGEAAAILGEGLCHLEAVLEDNRLRDPRVMYIVQ